MSSCWIWLSSRSVRWLIGWASRRLGHHLVALDHVALGDLDGAEADPALEAGRDLADIVLEALERLDATLGLDLAATEQADEAAAHDPAVGHVGAGHVARLAGLDHEADLRMAFDLLDQLRGKHALQGRAQVIGQLVDDVVEAHV